MGAGHHGSIQPDSLSMFGRHITGFASRHPVGSPHVNPLHCFGEPGTGNAVAVPAFRALSSANHLWLLPQPVRVEVGTCQPGPLVTAYGTWAGDPLYV